MDSRTYDSEDFLGTVNNGGGVDVGLNPLGATFGNRLVPMTREVPSGNPRRPWVDALTPGDSQRFVRTDPRARLGTGVDAAPQAKGLLLRVGTSLPNPMIGLKQACWRLPQQTVAAKI